jgi:hypothetical protein
MSVAPCLVTLFHLKDIGAEMLLQMVRKQQHSSYQYAKDSPEFNYSCSSTSAGMTLDNLCQYAKKSSFERTFSFKKRTTFLSETL